MHFQHARNTVDTCDGSEVTNEIIVEPVEQRRVDRVRRSGEEERISVRRSTYDRLRSNVGGSTRTILYDKLLAESLRQPLSDYARNDVVLAARRERDDQTHRPR